MSSNIVERGNVALHGSCARTRAITRRFSTTTRSATPQPSSRKCGETAEVAGKERVAGGELRFSIVTSDRAPHPENVPGPFYVEDAPRFSDTLHDWLALDDAFGDVRWQTAAACESGGSWQRTPW